MIAYNVGCEYHLPYFEHMLKLHEDLIKVDLEKSGICHHMMFETKYLNELISKIEKKHSDKFYNIFLYSVLDIHREHSGASEYELYFNYILKNHNDKIKLRLLNWENVSILDINNSLDYISYHWFKR